MAHSITMLAGQDSHEEICFSDDLLVCIRHGCCLAGLPKACVSDWEITGSHALMYHTGSYILAGHNRVQDLIAGLTH